MPYVCTKCESKIDIDAVTDKIICPHCSGRAVLKTRSELVRHVKAR